MAKFTKEELDKLVLNIDGTNAKLINDTGDGVVDFSIKLAFRKALNGVFQDEQPSLEDRLKRYDISKKVWNVEKEVTLKTEEMAEIKKCVGKMFQSPEVLGFLNTVIEKTK